MASGYTFSLAIAVLVNLYNVLNRITHSVNPSYSRLFFLSHHLYRWHAYYSQTHHVLHPTPPGRLMVHDSSPFPRRNNIGDVRKMICEGKVSELGCLMLAENRPGIIVDDGKLDDARSNYLETLNDNFLPICRGASFHVEPCSLHRFNRQFQFCLRISGVLLEHPHSREVSYEDALYY